MTLDQRTPALRPPHEVDLSDLDGFWTAPIEHRHAAFALLRQQPGVPFYPEPKVGQPEPGRGFYALTRLDDVAAASRRPEIFRSGQGVLVTDRRPEADEFFNSMISMDDPHHARLRRVVSRGFTPRRLARLTSSVYQTAGRIVDAVAERGACDAVTDIAAQLPLQVICELMGVPQSLHSFVFDRTNILLGPQDPEYVPAGHDAFAATLRAGAELAELMRELGSYRINHPGDDVISALLNARIDGERLTTQELASFFILLVIAGNETTRNAISWGIQALSEYPGQRAAWLAEPETISHTAVEEIIRWASPVIYMRRTLACDAILGGQRMLAGDKVALFYWAANRDPAHFTDPEVFDARRHPNRHVGFGGHGPHFCLGAHLARLEITAIFQELLGRIPDIHSTAKPDRLKSMFINGIKHLPVSFTPTARRQTDPLFHART